MQSVSIPVLQLGCLTTQYSYHRQFVTLQRHAAHIISISPVVTSVARGNIHLYRILVAVNCVTNNLHSSVTRAPFSGELIVASVSGSILPLSQTRDLTLTPKSPSGSVFRISYRVLFWHSGARFPKQGVSSSHLKSHFTPRSI